MKNFIESLIDLNQGSRHDVTERKQKLTDLCNQFVQCHRYSPIHIESLEIQDPSIIDKDALEQQIQQRSSFESPYFNLISLCESILKYFDNSEAQVLSRTTNNSPIHIRESLVRPPQSRASSIFRFL